MRETYVSTRQFIINKVNSKTPFTYWTNDNNAGRYVVGVQSIVTLPKNHAYPSLHEIVESVLTEKVSLQGVGGWLDENGTYFLDCIVGENDLSTAIEIGKNNLQLCIWDTKLDGEIWI